MTADGGQLNLGVGCSTFTLVNSGAVVNINGPSTSVTTLLTGTTSFFGTAVATAIVAAGGSTFPCSRPASGAAITTLTLAGGTVDFSGDGRGVTIGSFLPGNGSIKQSSPGQVTYTAISGFFTSSNFTSVSIQLQ